MDKPIFNVGDRVSHIQQEDSGGTVTKVIVVYEYEVEWDDHNPEWDIHAADQLEKK